MSVRPLKAGCEQVAGKRPLSSARPRQAVDLDQLADYARLYATVADAAALLGVADADLQALLDDPDSRHRDIWRRGRAEARLSVRRAQFTHLEKTASIAVHLGRELLGQDGAGGGAPVTFVVDTGIRRGGA